MNNLTPYICYPVAHDKGGNGSSSKTIIYTNRGSGSQVDTNNLTITNLHSTNGDFSYIQAAEGRIIRLAGKELEYQYGYIGELKTDTIEAKQITTEDLEAIKAWIETLNSREITTEYLTVTKQAHFFELIIDKIKSVGGQLIITPANCILDTAFAYDANGNIIQNVTSSNIDSVDNYKVYWRIEDEVTHTQIHNEWEVGDQALCQSFNDVHEGINSNVSSKYYWRVVEAVSDSPVWVNFNTGAVNYDGGGIIDKNVYEIQMLDTTYELNGSTNKNGIRWHAQAPNFAQMGIYPEVEWINGSAETGIAVNGTFRTASKTYGINIVPLPNDNGDPLYITDTLDFKIKQVVSDGIYKVPESISIGIYFTDDTFMTFNDVEINPEDNEDPESSWLCHLDLMSPDMPIEAIVITSAADVDWHKCHWMQLSNKYISKTGEPTKPAANSGCDYMLDQVASAPSRGDNLVQLGYRSSQDNLPLDSRDLENKRRQSAIIIAAYQSIDKGGQVYNEDSPYYGSIIDAIETPSYAQYMGINNFSLYEHRRTYFDAKGAKIIGDITLCSLGGSNIENVIKNAADTNILVPNKEKVQVNVITNTTSSINRNSLTRLMVELDYSINRNNADGIKEISKNFSGLTLEFEAYGQRYVNDNTVQDVKLQGVNGNKTIITTTGTDAGKYANSNYMDVIQNGTSRPTDYISCYKGQFREYCPVYIVVLLKKNDVVIDSRTINVAFESGAALAVTDDGIYSAVASSKTYTDNSVQGITNNLLNSATFIQQVADEVSQSAISGYITQNDLDETVEDLESQMTQSAGMIRSEVKRTYGTTADIITSDTYKYYVDLTPSTYYHGTFYRVIFQPQTTNYNEKHMFVVQIERNLESDYSTWGKPDWGKQDSPYGVELMCNYSCITGSTGQWSSMQLYCNQYYLDYSNGKAISRLYKDTSNNNQRFYMWVRGGSKFTVRANQALSSVSIGSTSDTETLVNIVEPEIYKPSMSVIEQTAESISLRVLEDVNIEGGVTKQELKSTGIDITSGSIVLDADKTRITGNLELTDAANGLTGYDSNGIARINLQPKPISDITPASADKRYNYASVNLTQQSTVPYFYSSGDDTFTFEDNFSLLINYVKIRLYTGANYPSSSTITCFIQVYSNNYNHSEEFRCTKVTDNFYYMDSPIKFDIYNQGGSATYHIKLNIKAFSSPSDANANFNSMHDAQIMAYPCKLLQTYIGTDGFYSHTGANQLFKIDQDYMLMQMGGCGLRMNADKDNLLKGRLETIADSSISSNKIVPNWVSFYNYKPLVQVGTGSETFTQRTIFLPAAEFKYAWQMDSTKHYGDILAMSLGGGGTQESWIVLPPANWSSGGINYHLPVGYKVTVWNFTRSDKLIVTPYRSSSNDGAFIYDAHNDQNDWVKLSGSQINETFVYIGNVYNNNNVWLEMHDVQ